jgi:putative membrane protein
MRKKSQTTVSRSILPALGALLLAVTATACSRDSGPRTSEKPSGDALTDAQILSVLTTANQGEVDFSRAAVTDATDPAVQKYADMMVQHHIEGVAKAKQTAADLHLDSDESAATAKLEADVKTETARVHLGHGAGVSEDVAFMCAQIRLHKGLLDTIDARLVPSAQDARVKTALDETRPVVLSHLDQARSIVQNLTSKASEDACREHGGL